MYIFSERHILRQDAATGALAGAAAGSAVPGIGTAIGAGIGFVGGILQNNASAKQARETNKFNAAQAEAQRDWQKWMSNTSYQRGTKDLIKAGLNPMLAYTQGGASTPSGSSASGVAAPVQDSVSKGLTGAMDILSYKKEMAALDSQTKVNMATELKQKADAKLAEQSARTAKSQEDMIDQQTLNAGFDYEYKKALMDVNVARDVKGAIADAAESDVRLKGARFDNKTSTYQNIVNKLVAPTASSAGSVINMFKPWNSPSSSQPKMRPGDSIIDRKGEIKYEH